jgi:RES domain
MPGFDSWESYNVFAQSVRCKARYVFEDQVDEFLHTVLATSNTRKMDFPSKRFLWRAQLGDHCEEVEIDGELSSEQGPLPRARMKPLAHSPHEGRVNPKGIPCLYLTTEKDTAMAEVRTWIGSYISVGQFETVKDLTLINCFRQQGTDLLHYWYSEEPDSDEREKAVWAHIDHAFSKPVSADNPTIEYIPTQILAELFRKNGFDGVVYKSLLGEGFNVALFDIDAAKLVNCFLYNAKSVAFKFEEAGNPYFLNTTPKGEE